MLTIHPASEAAIHLNEGGKPSVGLAIAGGGPVGAVYEIGALRALEESIDGLNLHKLDVYVGVSAGAFVAASLANGISCTELCRIFMGTEHAALKFVPELFLKPAYREYFERAKTMPGVLRDALIGILKNPATATPSELITELESAMLEAAQGLEFEKAASIRDKLAEVKAQPALQKVRLNKDEPAEVAPGTPGEKPRRKRKKKFR